MAFANPVSNIIVQSGTDTNLSGLVGNSGVTVTDFGALVCYDLGANQLRITGTLTINGDDTGDREMLVVGNGGGDNDIDVQISSGGTLNVGSRSVQGSTEFSSTASFPSIFEKDNLTFGTSNAKATAGQTTLGPGGNKPFLVADIGSTLNWFGCINCSGGIGFDGVGNDITTPATNSTVLIRGGVWDARRVTERSGVGDQFLYQYSADLTVDGFTVLSDEAVGIGATIILVQPPLQFKGYRPVMTEAALSGSTTVPLDFVVEIEDYGGVIGEGNVDGIMVASQDQQINSAVATFLNSEIGSLLNLVATQTFAVSQVMARQNVRATAIDPVGVAYTDAVVATQNRLSAIFEGRSEAVAAQGTMTLATQPSNGDQFTIDSKIYTFQTTLTNIDGNINIGGNLAATQIRVEDAINLTGAAGTDYATAMTIHPTVSCGTFAGNDAILTAKVAGDAGNSIALLRSFASIDNVFDYNKLGVTRPGSDLSDLNLGRLLMSEWNPDGGTTNPPILTTFNPSNTTDDLWTFFLYSYTGINRSRIDVLLRGAGGTEIEFITADDPGVTEATRSIVDAYSSIGDLGRLYDRSKSFKVNNVGVPSLGTPIALPSGDAIDLGALDLVVDGGFPSAYDVAAGVVTVNPSSAPRVSRVGATQVSVQGTESDEITVPFPSGIIDDDVAYLIIGHPESEDNTWNVPAGWATIIAELQTGGAPNSTPGLTVFRRVLSGDSGSVTVTNAGVNVSGIVGQMVVYRDVNLTTQEDTATTTATAASGDPDPAPITTTTDGCMILAIAIGDHEQTVNSAPASYGNLVTTSTPDGGDDGGGAPTVFGKFDFQTNSGADIDAFNFFWNGGGNTPPSSVVNTTPSWKHGPGSGGGSTNGAANQGEEGAGDGFLYVETSGNPAIGQTGEIEFDTTIDASANSILVNFFTNGGDSSNECIWRVQTNENGAGWVTRFSFDYTGNQEAQDIWTNHNVDLAGLVSNASTRVRIQVELQLNGTQLFLLDPSVDGITITVTPNGIAGDGATLSSAEFLQLTSALENPGTFDFSDDEEWATATIAIRQVPNSGGSVNLGATEKFNAINTTGTVTVRDGATIDGLIINSDVVLDQVIDLTNVTIGGDLTLQTAGIYNFDNVTVLGDTLNDDAGGNATINASNGSSLTTSEPGTGNGLVSIISTVPLTLTGLQDNTEVRVYTPDLLTELAGTENTTGGVFAATIDRGINPNVTIQIFSLNFAPVRIENIAVPVAGLNIPISQAVDRNFVNP